MSGGYFDYKQYNLIEYANAIIQEIYSSGKQIPEQRLDYWDKQRGREYFYKYNDKTI